MIAAVGIYCAVGLLHPTGKTWPLVRSMVANQRIRAYAKAVYPELSLRYPLKHLVFATYDWHSGGGYYLTYDKPDGTFFSVRVRGDGEIYDYDREEAYQATAGFYEANEKWIRWHYQDSLGVYYSVHWYYKEPDRPAVTLHLELEESEQYPLADQAAETKEMLIAACREYVTFLQEEDPDFCEGITNVDIRYHRKNETEEFRVWYRLSGEYGGDALETNLRAAVMEEVRRDRKTAKMTTKPIA